MKVGIVGAGAMGTIFYYIFRGVDIDTVLLARNSEAVSKIKQGLNVIVDDKTETVSADIDKNPNILKGCSIIFLFVKSYSTEEAMKGIKDFIDSDSIIVTLQNGIGNREVIAKFILEERIVYGSTSIGATKIDANTVRLGGMGNNIIGGASREALKSVEDVLKKANLDVQVTDDPDTAIWKKAIINAGINPLGALLSISNGLIVGNEYSTRLQEEIVREAVNVASSMGVILDSDEMVNLTRSVSEKTSKNLCSMLQDINAKRKTEIDSINGIIIEYGREQSINTPYNEAVYFLIKAKELC